MAQPGKGFPVPEDHGKTAAKGGASHQECGAENVQTLAWLGFRIVLGFVWHGTLRCFDSGMRKKLPKINTKLCMGLAQNKWLGYTILEIESERYLPGRMNPGC